MNQESDTLTLPVGALDGLGSLCYNLAEPLQEFSRRYEANKRLPQRSRLTPEWDLRRVQYPRMSVAALTAFIAIAHRLRLFSENVPQARLTWNPKVFAFLADAGVIELLRYYNIIDFPEKELAGYWHEVGKTNPSTRFLLLDRISEMPPHDPKERMEWKDETRRQLIGVLSDYTRAIFRPGKRVTLSSRLAQVVVSACAELCLNSNFWGKSPAAVGLQRSPAGITVAVADCGDGMLKSLRDKSLRHDAIDLDSHPLAVLVAAIYNRREYGLWRVIDEITALPNGWVSLWSFDAELHMRRPVWESIKYLDPRDVVQRMPLAIQHGRIDEVSRYTGYLRQWGTGIRGVRVTFEISFGRGDFS